MNNQQLKSSLGILEKEIVSIYGAGGKSTLLRLLAEELSGDGRKVVVTTTTKIYQHPDLPLVLGLNLQEAANGLKNNLAGSPLVILAGELLQGYKLKGIDPSWPGRLIEEPEVSCILAECDGAAGRPLKGYAPYEPVLPPDSSIAVPVLGLSSLGAILDSERVHRPALFSEMAGIKMGEIIKIEHLIRSMKRMIELGRRQAPRARVVPVFNQVDQVSDKRVIKRIAGFMAGYPEVDRLLFVSARQPSPVKYIFNLSSHQQAVPEVDCVVLAAGFSRRMGLDKLALDLGGTTVLERTLQNVLRSGVNETIVVINPEATDLEARLSKYNLKLIVNHRSSQGISTSVQAGLSSVAATSQGVIFALGDQPLIPARVYNSLLDSYRSGLQLALYPTYRRRRGNPVLFDRRTWPMLMELEGDKGGSQLFASLPASELCAVEMDIPEVLVDLDTPGDYENISDIFKPEGDS